MTNKNFTFTAHTGCEKTEYNSVESIKYGLSLTDTVEVDLNFTKSGKPVLAHTFAKESSTSPEEAFKVLSEHKNAKMNIDVKISGNLKPVYECAKKYGVEKNIFYTGIGPDKLENVKRDTPLVPFYLAVTLNPIFIKSEKYRLKVLKETVASGAMGINLDYRQCNKALTELMHKNGLLVSLYTCSSKRAIKKALALSPDNITTKTPTLMKNILKEEGLLSE